MKEKRYDIDFEIKFYEGILKKKGDFIQALVALGDLYTRKGFFEKGLQIDKKLSKLRSDDPIILYNLACSYSLVNDIDQAYSAMKSAIKYGYKDFQYLERDKDLVNLMKDNRFQDYISKIKIQKSLVAKKKYS